MDKLLGRHFKVSKFKSLVNLATSRISVFKNQHQLRCNQARFDVLQLLQQGHHERALLRVEHVIKEQNILDVFVMMDAYCNLLVERVHLIGQDRVCPDELKEAISGLIYASTRCGDFPELQEIRHVFTSRYGKEFAARAIELRNQCGVNPKMIQKLSTRQPGLDSRMRLLKEIASENHFIIQLADAFFQTEERQDNEKKRNQPKAKVSDGLQVSPEELAKTRYKYTNVAEAVQAAFESAASAAEAAKAAIELCRSKPHDPDNQWRKSSSEKYESMKLESDPRNHQLNNENEPAELIVNDAAEKKSSTPTTTSDSDSDSMEDYNYIRVNSMSLDPDHLAKQLEKDIEFNDSDSDGDSEREQDADKLRKKSLQLLKAGLEMESRHAYSIATREWRGY